VNRPWQPTEVQAPSRKQCGLPERGFVFCCFNASYKIDPQTFSAWMGILGQVPGSVLWLLDGGEHVRANLVREAERRGIAADRLIFAPRAPRALHLARHRCADLFLDTRPCNAHTTASDALRSGLPLLTCPGETFASRVGASLLRAADLPELITRDLEHYQQMAVNLATDREQLRRLRQRLTSSLSRAPLFDTARFARNLEQGLRGMWARWAAGGHPTPIEVVDRG
jgi:protein O-GlcNAc transferase